MTDPLVEVADDVWIVDDVPISAAGLQLPVRMTIIRLASGDLVLHSPTRYSAALRHRIEALGAIRYLVAPNVGHWMFIREWQQALPAAVTFAAPGLARRKQVGEAGLRIDQELRGDGPQEWADEIEIISIAAPLFTEVAFFHKASQTLILTDIVQNVPSKDMPLGPQLFARAIGITAPDGQAPIYLRLLVRCGGRAARQAADRLIALAPKQVVFAHGDWYRADATARLRRSLHWLAGDGSPSNEQIVKVAAVASVAALALGVIVLLRRRRASQQA